MQAGTRERERATDVFPADGGTALNAINVTDNVKSSGHRPFLLFTKADVDAEIMRALVILSSFGMLIVTHTESWTEEGATMLAVKSLRFHEIGRHQIAIDVRSWWFGFESQVGLTLLTVLSTTLR